MSELISGKEAKLAWANVEDVEYRDTINWLPLKNNCFLGIFDAEGVAFRIKPKNIKIELEIPAPFEPEDGEEYFGLNEDDISGCSKYTKGRFKVSIMAWRTEKEVKQVVAALRSIKK